MCLRLGLKNDRDAGLIRLVTFLLFLLFFLLLLLLFSFFFFSFSFFSFSFLSFSFFSFSGLFLFRLSGWCSRLGICDLGPGFLLCLLVLLFAVLLDSFDNKAYQEVKVFMGSELAN